MNLSSLAEHPFELLLELERRARAAIAARDGSSSAADEWVGIGFRLGAERFVANRGEVREVLPVPEQVTRVPGAKPWLRGIANLRGQLLTVVDLRSFLGAGGTPSDRHSRVLVVASRDVPTGLIVDEVTGFRRFASTDYERDAPPSVIRCEHYIQGCYRRDGEAYPRFSFMKLIEDPQFLEAGES